MINDVIAVFLSSSRRQLAANFKNLDHSSSTTIHASIPTMRIPLLTLLLCRHADAFQGFQNVRKLHHRFASAAAIEEKAETTYTFRSPETKVFIEDTDAYGIMYNGNYLRSFDRAIHLCTSSLVNDIDDESKQDRVTTQHENWSIVSMGHQKFVSSPSLGGNFVVEGTLKDSSKDLEVWDLKMMSPDGDTVFNTVQDLKIASPSEGTTFSSPPIEPFSLDENDSIVKGASHTCPIYRDEIDAHRNGQVPLRIVLNLFERARSNLLGGPDDLQRLQVEDDILVVVASMTDCSLMDENDNPIYPGQNLTVETSYEVKRRGMVLDCYQTLVDDKGSRLAQGLVTLMFIKNSTRRPTSKLPEWVKEGLGIA